MSSAHPIYHCKAEKLCCSLIKGEFSSLTLCRRWPCFRFLCFCQSIWDEMFCAEQWPEKHFILFIYSEILHWGCPGFFWGGRLNCSSVIKESSVSLLKVKSLTFTCSLPHIQRIFFICLSEGEKKERETLEQAKLQEHYQAVNMSTVLFSYVLTWDVLSRKWTVLKSEVQLCNKGICLEDKTASSLGEVLQSGVGNEFVENFWSLTEGGNYILIEDGNGTRNKFQKVALQLRLDTWGK